MFGFLKNLFGKPTDYAEIMKKGAVIVDVRTSGEYTGGHVKGSINIPLDRLSSKLNTLDKNKAIITCCASGMRSASAKSMLLSNGFKEVYNGGSWHAIRHLGK